MRQRGFAAVDYLATIAVVGILFAGLLVLRPHRVGPKSPVDVIPPIVRLLGHPIQNLEPPRPHPPRPASPRPHPRRPRAAGRRADGSAVVLLPEWWRAQRR